jgi:hypothetical protein
MKRTKWNPRKVLIASAGVASVNYALAAGCGGESLVANLVACPASQCPEGGGNGGASVANLVAPPPGGSFFGGSGGISGDGGATVANLVAPPPGGMPNLPDASTPDAPDDAGAADAAPDGAA